MKKISRAVVQAVSAGIVVSVAATAVQAQQQPQKVEKIEVTGSNIKRIEGESALPLTVITKEDIEKSGATTAAQLLDKLQLNSGATYSIAQGVGDSGQAGFAGASLRGLGPNNTLILLNGRRVANYAFNGAAVDINSIPLAAVERVEVLKDGASAIYGTDAIGGVINFILKTDFQGIEGSYYKTNVDRGGGNAEKYTVTVGFGNLATQRFNILASFDREESDPIAAKQRSFAATAIRPDLGFQRTSANVLPAAIRFDANGGLGNANILAAAGCAPQVGSFYLPNVSTRQCRYDFTSRLEIFPPVERDSLVAKATFQLNENTRIFGEYMLVKNKARYASSETPVNDFLGNGPFIYPAGGRYYPAPFRLPDGTLITPTGNLGIAWRAQDGGRRTNVANSEATRSVVGVKGAFANWDYEGAYNKSESKVTDTYVDGWFRESLLKAAIRTGNINIFSITGQDATGAALLQGAKILEDVRRSKGTVESFDLKGSTELMQMAAGPLALAAGVESREEKYNDNPLPVQSSGDILGGGGNQPVASADRRVNAVFAEINVPLTKTLEAQFAIRSDRYSDFGSSTNPKVSVRWTPSKVVLVRSSYNTGFRAPSLPDLFQPRFFSNTADSHSDPIRCPGGRAIGGFVDNGLECNAQIKNQLGGVSTLKPEKSRQATLGILFEPRAGITFGADAFWIGRTNSLGSSQSQGVSDRTVFNYFGVLDPLNAGGAFVRQLRNASGGCVRDATGSPTPANVPCAINFVVMVQQNAGVYTQTGVDVATAVNFSAGVIGKFRASLDGTYIHKYSYQFAKDGPVTNNVGVFTADNGAVSRWRQVLALNWANGPWGATLSQNFVQGYRDSSGGRQVGNVETYDLNSTWSGIKGLQLVLGIKNLFDRDPPASNQGQTFQVGYDPRYGDPFGRVYYGKISYSFK